MLACHSKILFMCLILMTLHITVPFLSRGIHFTYMYIHFTYMYIHILVYIFIAFRFLTDIYCHFLAYVYLFVCLRCTQVCKFYVLFIEKCSFCYNKTHERKNFRWNSNISVSNHNNKSTSGVERPVEISQAFCSNKQGNDTRKRHRLQTKKGK